MVNPATLNFEVGGPLMATARVADGIAFKYTRATRTFEESITKCDSGSLSPSAEVPE